MKENAMREHLERTLYDLTAGWDGAESYASGVCHTLRALGYFTDAEITRWSVTPIIRAQCEMLERAIEITKPA